jgi:sulfite reductase alpha subunit-like flavoprotein
MPSNSRTFWKKLLRKKLPSSYLEHVHFALFGLGDSSYAKCVDKRFQAISAQGNADLIGRLESSTKGLCSLEASKSVPQAKAMDNIRKGNSEGCLL